MYKKLAIGLSILLSKTAHAGLQQRSSTLGDISGTLLDTTGVLGGVMDAVCIVVGIALLAGAVSQYQIHKTNPKLVPLVNPITYAVLSILVFAIPTVGYISNLSESEWGPSEDIVAP